MKKNRNKLISLFLVFLFSAAAMSGCSGSKTTDPIEPPADSNQTNNNNPNSGVKPEENEKVTQDAASKNGSNLEKDLAKTELIFDNKFADTVLTTINGSRTADGKATFTNNAGLEKIAKTYAQILFDAGQDFRNNTDYQTLPSGEKVYSLVKATDYDGTVSNFTYSVWKNNIGASKNVLQNLGDTVLKSKQYQTKAIDGNYANVGIACGYSSSTEDPYTVIILVFSN